MSLVKTSYRCLHLSGKENIKCDKCTLNTIINYNISRPIYNNNEHDNILINNLYIYLYLLFNICENNISCEHVLNDTINKINLINNNILITTNIDNDTKINILNHLFNIFINKYTHLFSLLNNIKIINIINNTLENNNNILSSYIKNNYTYFNKLNNINYIVYFIFILCILIFLIIIIFKL